MNTWLIATQLIVLAMLGAALVLSIWTFHKVRKIHLATYDISNDSRKAAQESTVLFDQLQALTALERRLSLPESLPRMRGWAGSPDFLLTVADEVLNDKPSTVVECSSGVSTVIIARCLQINNHGHVFSLEHDPEYAAKSTDLLERYGLSDWATVLHAPLSRNGNEAPWYSDTSLPGTLNSIDLLVIDGPPHDTAPLARLPALPRLLPRLADSSKVILDDAARAAETEIVKRWLEMAPEFRVRWLPHEKGCAILQRG